MKASLFFAVFFLYAVRLIVAGDQIEKGTLLMQGNKVTYTNSVKKKKFIYHLPEIPWMKMISYTPRSLQKNHTDVDISKAIFENISTGKKLILVNAIPLKVIFRSNSKNASWEPDTE